VIDFSITFQNSRPDTIFTFIQYSYFDSLQFGFLAGEQLTHDICHIETAYMNMNLMEYEMLKNVSLDQIDPYALVTLQTTGSCTFSILESVFDLDGPGHCMRRNKSVSLSIRSMLELWFQYPRSSRLSLSDIA
jgi:hypothetical protein